MHKIRLLIRLSLTLFATALLAEIGRRAFHWPLPRDVTELTLALAGFAVIGTYCTQLVTTRISATAFEFRKVLVEENRALYRSLICDLEEYGKRREIHGHLVNERRRVTNERAGDETVEIGEKTERRANVSPLLRKHG